MLLLLGSPPQRHLREREITPVADVSTAFQNQNGVLCSLPTDLNF